MINSLVKTSKVYLILCIVELLLIGVFYINSYYFRDNPESSSQIWVATWGGNGKDYSRSVAYSQGFLYVTGETTSYGPGNESVFLLKYSINGSLVWNRTWGGKGYSMGRGIIVTGGNIYVCGIRSIDNKSSSLVLKFNENGSLEWNAEWRGKTDTYGRGIALDPSGSIYVAGYMAGNHSTTQAFIIKYDPVGSLQWTRIFNMTEHETGWSVTVSDGVYLSCTTGKSEFQSISTVTNPNTVMTLRKLGFDGRLQWSKSWGIGFENYGLAVTTFKGKILQAGFSRLMNGTAKASLIEYNQNGDLISAHIYGDSPEVYAWGVVPVGQYVYLVGQWMDPGYMDAKNAYVLKVDRDGNILWYRTWGGFGDDIGRSAVVVGDNLYFTGITYGLGNDGQVFLIDYFSPNPSCDPTNLIELSSFLVGAALFLIILYDGLKHMINRNNSSV